MRELLGDVGYLGGVVDEVAHTTMKRDEVDLDLAGPLDNDGNERHIDQSRKVRLGDRRGST